MRWCAGISGCVFAVSRPSGISSVASPQEKPMTSFMGEMAITLPERREERG
jgi:hypothetical protein